ncbi:HisA/HisF-related TIM barrel protein [Robiginitalea marina]|uniref:1-(5-phosphoribosyl)-5-[(5-phosphoribosylamino)methylideneamino] imidazole-4-carboxamide isomerase n=1 Tax=Robiginitalea marina TaxID=2954105 RepID=A0ABT1AU77_9FLAO|nr:1-(5-phosphoribosyl)-5-[(5-phosphoribosylamino)methylideneamino] imidazole-4-carboxamide isomerase [Robiginitalea marina]MCO5723565.1 1-(5-phosphoribosyl)-5-[(5-phosphoribosylamino)methylideneamino] imidazole-4-carboxamide isomerase [Robiginitalea marina]
MRIIPAIDLIDGKCVRLTRGDYATQKVYSEDPLEVARAFEDAGIRYLHLVDLDGARQSHIVNHGVLEAIAGKTGLQIDFGGGLKSDEDVRIAFDSGAAQVTGGSIAATNPGLFLSWLEAYGPEKIILGADAREGRIAVSGWQEDTGQKLLPFVSGYQKKGVKYVVCTDISRDGMLGGPSLDLYRELLRKTAIIETRVGMSGVEDIEIPGIRLVASGGVSSLDDLLALRDVGCDGAIVGKAFYEGRITLKELERFNLES